MDRYISMYIYIYRYKERERGQIKEPTDRTERGERAVEIDRQKRIMTRRREVGAPFFIVILFHPSPSILSGTLERTRMTWALSRDPSSATYGPTSSLLGFKELFFSLVPF